MVKHSQKKPCCNQEGIQLRRAFRIQLLLGRWRRGGLANPIGLVAACQELARVVLAKELDLKPKSQDPVKKLMDFVLSEL